MESKEIKSEGSSGEVLIAHLADSHLRDSQYSRRGRGIDFFLSFKDAVTKAIENADILVMCGDIFNVSRPSPAVIQQVMRIDSLLKASGKMMLSITGNHDMMTPTWLETLFFDNKESGIIPLDDKSMTFMGCKFVGVSPRTKKGFLDIKDDLEPGDVLLYHYPVSEFAMFVSENNLTLDDLPTDKYKAILLGDIHVTKYIKHNTCLVGYPGSTEMCSASESTDKVVPIVSVSKDFSIVEASKTLRVDIRPFIKGTIKDPQDADVLLGRIKDVADKNPTIIVKYSRELEGFLPRIYSAVDSTQCVVRCTPLEMEHDEMVLTTKPILTPISDFVAGRIDPDNEDLYELGLKLTSPSAQVEGLLDIYVENKLKVTCK